MRELIGNKVDQLQVLSSTGVWESAADLVFRTKPRVAREVKMIFNSQGPVAFATNHIPRTCPGEEVVTLREVIEGPPKKKYVRVRLYRRNGEDRLMALSEEEANLTTNTPLQATQLRWVSEIVDVEVQS